MKRVERLLQEQQSLRRKIWGQYCSKDYPKSLSKQRFLTTILHQAKKTYLRYVRFYMSINWCDQNTEEKLYTAEMNISKLFLDLATVYHVFKVDFQKNKSTKAQYSAFLLTVEQFSIGVFDDYHFIAGKVKEQLKEKVAA